MDAINLMTDLAGFGAAGLMGAMWLWERRLSGLREQQLDEAHGRILRDEQRLGSLTRVVEHNTAAIAKFTELQRQMLDVLKHMHEESHHEAIR